MKVVSFDESLVIGRNWEKCARGSFRFRYTLSHSPLESRGSRRLESCLMPFLPINIRYKYTIIYVCVHICSISQLTSSRDHINGQDHDNDNIKVDST